MSPSSRCGRRHFSKPRGGAAGPGGGLPFVKLSAVRDKTEISFYQADREKRSRGGMNGLGQSFS